MSRIFTTMRAMAALSAARMLISFVPFSRWRSTLGRSDPASGNAGPEAIAVGQGIANQIERGAQRLPFETRCLPRSMAVSWILRRKRIDHAVVLAVRPAKKRKNDDVLHAWVEIEGTKIIGDVPGPWIETLRLGS
ncbi:MAG TPA: lasso peptide biosynthesis B2 protein [Sphingomicrobium sp.]|nr:lasso peptide biosynthesis B2 protein [Sphingomicrobium sp.]